MYWRERQIIANSIVSNSNIKKFSYFENKLRLLFELDFKHGWYAILLRIPKLV